MGTLERRLANLEAQRVSGHGRTDEVTGPWLASLTGGQRATPEEAAWAAEYLAQLSAACKSKSHAPTSHETEAGHGNA